MQTYAIIAQEDAPPAVEEDRPGGYGIFIMMGLIFVVFYMLLIRPQRKKEKDRQLQKTGWTELARYVRAIDPYHHPVTIHPTGCGRDQVEDYARRKGIPLREAERWLRPALAYDP